MPQYKVMIADNYHYMDESEWSTLGEFATYDQALAAAQQRVVASLQECLAVTRNPPIPLTPEVLYDNYIMFGDDPFILPDDHTPIFSAWTYAKSRCQDIWRAHLDTWSTPE